MYVNVKEIEGTNILQTILKENIKRKNIVYILKQEENTKKQMIQHRANILLR